MSISFKLKRNSSVAGDKSSAAEALVAELQKTQAGEPRIATYADDSSRIGILFGISAGDGSYAIFDNHFKTINNEAILGDGNIDTFPSVQLTDEDLNSLVDLQSVVGKGYYGLPTNSVGNKPEGVTAFFLQCAMVGDTSVLQLLYSISDAKQYSREYNGSTWGDWAETNKGVFSMTSRYGIYLDRNIPNLNVDSLGTGSFAVINYRYEINLSGEQGATTYTVDNFKANKLSSFLVPSVTKLYDYRDADAGVINRATVTAVDDGARTVTVDKTLNPDKIFSRDANIRVLNNANGMTSWLWNSGQAAGR